MPIRSERWQIRSWSEKRRASCQLRSCRLRTGPSSAASFHVECWSFLEFRHAVVTLGLHLCPGVVWGGCFLCVLETAGAEWACA
eukprot:10981460-Alexandrium_andersonii.AAC.1